MSDTKLLNLHHDMDPNLFISHERGSHQIDFFLGTAPIVQTLTYAGILEMNHGLTPSDHRPLFIDLNELTLFGKGSDNLTNRLGRGLNTNDTRILEIYKTVLHTQLDHHQVLKRADALFHLAQNPPPDKAKAIHTYNKIDLDSAKAMLCTKKTFSHQTRPFLVIHTS